MRRPCVFFLLAAISFACATAPCEEPVPSPPVMEGVSVRYVRPLFVPPVLWNSTVEILSYLAEAPARIPATLIVRPLSEKAGVLCMGTGTVVRRQAQSLLVLTAAHVVSDAQAIVVRRWGKDFPATVVVSDTLADVAILRIADDSRFRVAPLALELPEPGATLWCCGNALGDGLSISNGPMRSDELFDVGGGCVLARGGYNALPGCSGGGVWYDGQIVGVVSAVAVGPKQIYVHMGFFAPINQIRRVLGEVKD